MNYPDAAIEEVAKIVSAHEGDTWITAVHRAVAKEILEAAAAYLMADAWEEGQRSTRYPDGSPISLTHHLPANPYRPADAI